MYAAGREHKYKISCSWIVTEIESRNINAVTDTEIPQEILHRYSMIGLPDKAIEPSKKLYDLVPEMLPVNRQDINKAIKLYEKYYTKGVRSRDVIHTAVMENNKIAQLISTDTHFDLIESVTRIDPIDLYQSQQVTGDVK
jgi:predicted nucleic acid-binding protein